MGTVRALYRHYSSQHHTADVKHKVSCHSWQLLISWQWMENISCKKSFMLFQFQKKQRLRPGNLILNPTFSLDFLFNQKHTKNPFLVSISSPEKGFLVLCFSYLMRHQRLKRPSSFWFMLIVSIEGVNHYWTVSVCVCVRVRSQHLNSWILLNFGICFLPYCWCCCHY